MDRKQRAQDLVYKNYKARFSLTDKQMGDLHMFFSPTRVPKGLRLEEVKIVLLLYQLRDADRKKRTDQVGLNLNAVLSVSMLPPELTAMTRMTRARFKIGVYKMLRAMSLN